MVLIISSFLIMVIPMQKQQRKINEAILATVLGTKKWDVKEEDRVVEVVEGTESARSPEIGTLVVTPMGKVREEM